MNKLKRGNIQYTDIENFEDFEFTSCLSYEMAIRNNEVIELLKKDNLDDILLTKYYLGSEFYLNYHFFPDFYKLEKGTIDSDSKSMVTYDDSESYYEEKIEDIDEIKIINRHKGFITITSVMDSNVAERNVLYPHFKRPNMEPYPVIKDIEVMMNFALPEKELIDYITYIKKEFSKDNTILKSGYEILTKEKFEKSEDIKPRDILSNKIYSSDMLFIYDCMKLGYKAFEIRNELYNYYSDVKGKETRTMTEKTIKKYYDIAIDYIDNRRYKELVTGINLDELENNNN